MKLLQAPLEELILYMFTSSAVESGDTLSVNSYAGDPLAAVLSKWRIGLIAFAAMYLAFYIGNSTLVIIVFALFWPDEHSTLQRWNMIKALKVVLIAYGVIRTVMGLMGITMHGLVANIYGFREVAG